jgi:hypothetical protein
MKSLIIFSLLVAPLMTLAQSDSKICSAEGYTVITINGIFTDKDGAIENKDKLDRILPDKYKNEPIKVDYLYNPSHLAGLGDLVSVINQGLFEQKSDYDLVEMLHDASQKVTTQKFLIVAHSQGNFYANNFYDKVAGVSGGVPAESVGVYSVATPAYRVAGYGKYVTSDTDHVIAKVVGTDLSLTILPPNIHIDLKDEPGANGHSFSGVYLKYQGDRIVSDIQSSLGKLKTNTVQDENKPCIAPQKITILHKVASVALAVADPVVAAATNVTVLATKGSYYAGRAISNAIDRTVLAVGGLGKSLFASVFLAEQTGPVNPSMEQNLLVQELHLLHNDDTPSRVEPKITPAPISQPEEKTATIQTVPQIPVVQTVLRSVDPLPTTRGEGVSHGGGGKNPVSLISTIPVPSITSPALTPDTTAPVITLHGSSFEPVAINATYVDAGVTALDAVDGVVSLTSDGAVDTATLGDYVVTYSATDAAGNVATATRHVKVSPYVYQATYDFGRGNGDGRDWQVWAFNGSNIYDWSDTYENDYLREQFKIHAYSGGFVCSQCLQQGVFNHDPRLGFKASDLTIGGLTYNPQNNGNNVTYDVVLQWDATGYTYTVSHDSTVDATGHTDVSGVDDDTWVGWDGSYNAFRTFPSGDWQGASGYFPLGRTGGGGMILRPYPVHVVSTTPTTPTLTMPTSGRSAGRGISATRGRSNLTSFTFEVVYTDPANNPPTSVTLHVKNSTSGASLPDQSLQKVGEFYTYTSTYDTSEYEYYFSAVDANGNSLHTQTLYFATVPSTYTYIPQYTFGTGNGDGRDWQVWAFNGSNIYDWSDVYVSNYLHTRFKVQAYSGGFYCSQCLQVGVFNHDPKLGFESVDVSTRGLDSNPQNNGNNVTYDVDIQWDSAGYTYTVSHVSSVDNSVVVDGSGHTDIGNINSNTWVGWDESHNNFQTFPSGSWQGASGYFPGGMTGGGGMVLTPYPVYVYSGEPVTPPPPDPAPVTPDPVIPDPTPTVDTTPPAVTSYSLNSSTENITLNPTVDHVLVVLNSSENVNWLSIKIENQADTGIYKIFQSGSTCVDGGSTCSKSWNGSLSSGGVLIDGVYRIKVHMKDAANNEYDDYLPVVINVVM